MQLETDRLLIRELAPDDWRAMQRIAMDFGQSEYVIYDMPLPTQDAEIRELTARFAASGLFYAVLMKTTKDMVGYICFHAENGSYDLGYCFHSTYQGQGYAFESCSVLLEAFARCHYARAFTAGTALRNIPSCKLLRKLGFELTGTEMISFQKGISFEGGIFRKCVVEEIE